MPGPEADQDFMELEDYTILRALFKEEECKIMTVKLGTKLWRRLVQGRSPEACISLAS